MIRPWFQIWLPDVEVLNLKMFQALDVLDKLQGLWVSQNNEILYVLAARITFICAMSFEAFPLDIQTCLFQVRRALLSFNYLRFLFRNATLAACLFLMAFIKKEFFS